MARVGNKCHRAHPTWLNSSWAYNATRVCKIRLRAQEVVSLFVECILQRLSGPYKNQHGNQKDPHSTLSFAAIPNM